MLAAAAFKEIGCRIESGMTGSTVILDRARARGDPESTFRNGMTIFIECVAHE
jgi:hypothetical protein